MKNYLDLIPISAKIHRRQTRMTRWCIVISVFLISAIFGMADMFLRSQKNLAVMQGQGVIDQEGEEKQKMGIEDILTKFNEISIECGN